MLTLILTFSLREKEPDFDPRMVRRNFLREKKSQFDTDVVRRNSLSLRERARVRVTSAAMNLLKA